MRVLIVVAQRYNGHELWTALGVLQQAGVEFEVVSTQTLIQDEVTNQPNRIGLTLEDVTPEQVAQYDGLMFISGNMKDTEKYWKLPRTLAYVDVAKEADMPIAAICCSVPTIRNAAEGKRVSFFPLVRSKWLLQEAGAILATVSITVDGKLVTAEHQMCTQMWTEFFIRVLKGEEVDTGLVDSKYKPGSLRPRKLPPEVAYMKKRAISGN